MTRVFCLLAIGLSLSLSTLHAQDAASFDDRLHAAESGTSLDAPDTKPWHAKMTVQLFARSGQVADEGTIEEWWNSPDQDRREYQTKRYTATEIRTGGKIYRTKGVDLPPYLLELLRQQVVHPVSLPEKPQADLHKLTVGKIALECIQLRTAQEKGPDTLGTSRAYCLDPGNTSLRMTLDHSIMQMVRERIGQFQGKRVAVDAVVSGSGVKLATEHIESLAGGVAPDSFFAVSDETPEVVLPVISGDDPRSIAPTPITNVYPNFPAQAKAQHVEKGTVVVRAIIGIDGKPRSVTVIASSNPVFEGETLDAARQWKYKPGSADGRPAEVDIISVMNFSLM